MRGVRRLICLLAQTGKAEAEIEMYIREQAEESSLIDYYWRR